jgi:hypothetical protein
MAKVISGDSFRSSMKPPTSMQLMDEFGHKVFDAVVTIG